MSSSSDRKDTRPAAQGGPFLNVAAPAGSKSAGKNTSSYSRFIPSEELGAFKAWQPGALAGVERRTEERRHDDRGTADRRAPGVADGPPPASAAAPGATRTGGASSVSSAPAPGPSATEWQARVTAARQAGYQDGYRDGLVALEGFKQSFAQQNTAQIGALLTAFDEQLQALDGDIAQALARTALLLAQQVLRTEVQQRPEVVADVARQAVNTVMHSARQVTVHVHPQDLPLVNQGAEEVLKARGARLRADSSILRGGVLVSSDVGTVDARVGTRWAEAVVALGAAALPFEETAAEAATGSTTPVSTHKSAHKPTPQSETEAETEHAAGH